MARIRLSAAVAASALAGAVLASASWAEAVLTTFGILFLAAGASALNQVQERELDARMARTRNRPLPAGRLSPRQGLTLALLLLAGGILLLLVIRPLAGSLGTAAVLLYNGAYTPLKRRTLFALLPGALAGALPPIIGWCAAGGPVADPRILLPAGCLFLWQVPHFWFFAARCREDLETVGLPSPARFGPRPAARILAAWLVSLGVGAFATLTLSPSMSILGLVTGLGLFLYLGLLSLRLYFCLPPSPLSLTRQVNAAMACLMLILVAREMLP